MLKVDRHRALGGMLWVAVAAGLFLYLHAVSYLLGDETGDPLMLFEMSATMGYVAPVMPLVAALPFGGGLCQDIAANFAGAAVMRSGRGRYIASKVVACVLSGGLASMLSMFCFIAFAHLRFPTDFPVPDMLEMTGLHALLAQGGLAAHLSYYGVRLFLVFCSGAFWAMCALCFSAFYPSLPLTLVCPLALWRLALEIGEKGNLPSFLDVALLDDGSAAMGAGPMMLSALALYGALALALALLFRWRAGRRLGNER